MEEETKTSTGEQEVVNKEEAFSHLAQGKRHLLVKDYNEAVTSLGMACNLLSNLYGEFANECGEAYFNYGKALLELARTENGVLGIEGEREESQDSEEGDDEGEEEKDEIKNTENGESKEEKDEENDSKGEKERNGKIGEGEEKEKSTEEEAEDEDDVDNLHLAWEMLEMAKIVFERQAKENKKMSLKLAEVHLKLGEVGLESENYTQAVDDIKKCLEIQLENLEKHDRCIAETHYQLGMAYTLSNEFDNAAEQYKHAVTLLEKRIDYLQDREKEGKTTEDHNENNPFYTIKEEIAEINALLPEVKEKINDVEDYKKETMKALFATIGASGDKKTDGEGTSSGASTTSAAVSSNPFSSNSGSDEKPVTNISHLVRKKRKLDSDSTEEKNPKQQCPEVSKPE